MGEVLLLCVIIFIQAIANFFIEVIYRLVVKYKDIDSYKDIAELERDIEVEYSPAVASMLYDNRIEPDKDIIAVILNLSLKGYISFYRNEKQKYEIKPNINNNDNKPLSIEEEYIYKWILGKKEFNLMEWVKLVKLEYKKYNFIQGVKSTQRNIIEIMIMVIFALIYIIELPRVVMYYSENIPMLVMGVVVVPLVMIITSVTIHELLKNTFLNTMGNKEVKRWTKFKRFMSKYTLIEERNPEEMVIYEKYLPYSMALNVNKEYKTVWEDIVQKDERKRIMLHYRISENIFFKPFLNLDG